jgi:hypothetical protein
MNFSMNEPGGVRKFRKRSTNNAVKAQIGILRSCKRVGSFPHSYFASLTEYPSPLAVLG